ncbi:hypothetical protein BASA81_012740 [Batrachochytrium salamandrivorans]|nr:hypothetical protein BASA81_012740 [Batrachochytrium salamandrivorans]
MFAEFQREQEDTRLAIMGSAVCVAASSIFFSVRLLDAALDLFFHSASSLNANTTAYLAYLEFKRSGELANFTFALVYPLLFMRVFGSTRDVLENFLVVENGSENGVLVLDVCDFVVLVVTLLWGVFVLPVVEQRQVASGALDSELEYVHLVGLLQAGLLAMFSLLKLFSQLERSGVRNKVLFLGASAERLKQQQLLLQQQEQQDAEEEEEQEAVPQAVQEKPISPPPPLWKQVEVSKSLPLAELADHPENEDTGLFLRIAVGVCAFVLAFKAV